jgi:hypothetical protein
LKHSLLVTRLKDEKVEGGWTLTTEQKRTVLLLMLVSTLIGTSIRLVDITQSSHELVSFHSLDILILLIIMVLSGTGLLLMNANSDYNKKAKVK